MALRNCKRLCVLLVALTMLAVFIVTQYELVEFESLVNDSFLTANSNGSFLRQGEGYRYEQSMGQGQDVATPEGALYADISPMQEGQFLKKVFCTMGFSNSVSLCLSKSTCMPSYIFHHTVLL